MDQPEALGGVTFCAPSQVWPPALSRTVKRGKLIGESRKEKFIYEITLGRGTKESSDYPYPGRCLRP